MDKDDELYEVYKGLHKRLWSQMARLTYDERKKCGFDVSTCKSVIFGRGYMKNWKVRRPISNCYACEYAVAKKRMYCKCDRCMFCPVNWLGRKLDPNWWYYYVDPPCCAYPSPYEKLNTAQEQDRWEELCIEIANLWV